MIPYPHIDPVLVSIGPVDIRWYGLAYLVGFLLGRQYAVHITKQEENPPVTANHIDDFIMLWGFLGVILGGRIGYVLFYQPGFYLDDPLAAFKIWEGGMAFHGSVAGVLIAMLAYTRLKGISLLRLSDIICTVTPVGLFFGRIANFINGELFGRVTDAPWAMIFPDGGPLPRHPSQLYEAGLEGLLLGIILAVMIHNKTIRDKPGLLSGVFMVGYGLARFTVEFLREPDPQLGFLFGEWLTMGQILSLPMIFIGEALIIMAFWKSKKSHDLA